MRRVRRLLLALPLSGALAFSGCGSHTKDETLGRSCDRVNSAVSNAVINRGEIAAFGTSLARWSRAGDQATRAALAPLVASANAYAMAPDAQHAAREDQFWDEFGVVADECRSNGTPKRPRRPEGCNAGANARRPRARPRGAFRRPCTGPASRSGDRPGRVLRSSVEIAGHTRLYKS